MNKYLERVNGWHYWNRGVVSYAMTPRCHSTQEFFFIVTSIVYAILFSMDYGHDVNSVFGESQENVGANG
jgi:hypothetical protein